MEKPNIIISTPEEEIAENGFYLLKSKTGSLFIRFMLLLDLFLFALLYLFVGLGTSYFLNRYTTTSLNRNQKKSEIFGEIVLEIIFTVVGLFIAVLILGNLPSIVKNPPTVHKLIRTWESSIILVFTVIVLQTKLTEKLIYVFN